MASPARAPPRRYKNRLPLPEPAHRDLLQERPQGSHDEKLGPCRGTSEGMETQPSNRGCVLSGAVARPEPAEIQVARRRGVEPTLRRCPGRMSCLSRPSSQQGKPETLLALTPAIGIAVTVTTSSAACNPRSSESSTPSGWYQAAESKGLVGAPSCGELPTVS
jgi:hypothetical protein